MLLTTRKTVHLTIRLDGMFAFWPSIVVTDLLGGLLAVRLALAVSLKLLVICPDANIVIERTKEMSIRQKSLRASYREIACNRSPLARSRRSALKLSSGHIYAKQTIRDSARAKAALSKMHPRLL